MTTAIAARPHSRDDTGRRLEAGAISSGVAGTAEAPARDGVSRMPFSADRGVGTYFFFVAGRLRGFGFGLFLLLGFGPNLPSFLSVVFFAIESPLSGPERA
jgi:hypothetical protein